MRRGRYKVLVLTISVLLGGCALFGGPGIGGDPRGLALKQRGAAVVLALERFRRDNGRLPAHLFELLPKYLPQIPDGLATIYKPEDGTLAFSYQRTPGSVTTTCEIAIGRRVWDCTDSL